MEQGQELLSARQSPADRRGTDDEGAQKAEGEDSRRDTGGNAQDQARPGERVWEQGGNRREHDEKRIEKHTGVIQSDGGQCQQNPRRQRDEDDEQQGIRIGRKQDGTDNQPDAGTDQETRANDPDFAELIAEKTLRQGKDRPKPEG